MKALFRSTANSKVLARPLVRARLTPMWWRERGAEGGRWREKAHTRCPSQGLKLVHICINFLWTILLLPELLPYISSGLMNKIVQEMQVP